MIRKRALEGPSALRCVVGTNLSRSTEISQPGVLKAPMSGVQRIVQLLREHAKYMRRPVRYTLLTLA